MTARAPRPYAMRIIRLIAINLIAIHAMNARAVGSFDAQKQAYSSSEAWLLDRHGEPIQRLRVNADVRRGAWVALDDVSPALRRALVLSEDQRFYEHAGIDWQAVGNAAWGNVQGQKTRGASTISMQLAGLLEQDLRQRGGRSATQKVSQAVAAYQMERSWSKAQILEAYLNFVPFRGELVGVGAMSQSLFAKAPHGLDESEAAIAAVLVRAPNAPLARVTARSCLLLARMRGVPQLTQTDCEALALLTRSALEQRRYAPAQGIAPHLAQRLLRKNGADQPSSLDAKLQRFAQASVQRHLRELEGRNVQDAAVVVLHNATGQVLAYVGGSPGSSAAQVDAVQAPRQAGSTLKPFLYAQAIAERRLTAASLLDDSPAQISTGSGLYIPQNYDRRFKSWVSVRTALGASLNVPAVRALVMVGPNAFARQLKALGIALKHSGEHYGYSLALGSAEISLLQLTNSYRSLANGGRYSDVAFSTAQKPTWAQALDADSAFIVSDILNDSYARAATFGSDSVLNTRFWTAVKTGTSKDMRDNWAVGYSQHYTVGVWVGNADAQPMWNVSGAHGAAPIWADVMNHLHTQVQALPSRTPLPAPHVRKLAVRYAGVQEADRHEWFLPGTEPTAISSIASYAINTRANEPFDVKNLKISAPSHSSVIALDPDIPLLNQRLLLASNAPAPLRPRWLLNGREIGKGAQMKWLPMPGRHVLSLQDAQGHTRDEVQLEVRGAGLKLASAALPKAATRRRE
jgi:penicillin-binding protein 1C